MNIVIKFVRFEISIQVPRALELGGTPCKVAKTKCLLVFVVIMVARPEM